MTFLKQHFYIDAGINLPIEGDNNNTAEAEVIVTNTTTATAYTTINMTDDVKVNMRRKKGDTAHKTKMKRFSHSEIPTYSPQIVDKRRSLNIQREVSKIPVILKSVENVQSLHRHKHAEQSFKRNHSNLPVPVK